MVLNVNERVRARAVCTHSCLCLIYHRELIYGVLIVPDINKLLKLEKFKHL